MGKSREYPILGENTPFWAKMPFFGQKLRKYSILGENASLGAKVLKIFQLWELEPKCVVLVTRDAYATRCKGPGTS